MYRALCDIINCSVIYVIVMERATDAEVFGCGSPQSSNMTLNIHTTTGGNFTVSLNGKDTVDSLKKLVSKKLKVSKDRICLLHRDRQLTDGTLEENSLLDGSRVVLLPSVETGLLNQRHENSVIQALESLNDTQVNDFLSGKSPLNLTMRLGDHMMLIQLQLSTLNSNRNKASASKSSSSSAPIRISKRNVLDPLGNFDGDDFVRARNIANAEANNAHNSNKKNNGKTSAGTTESKSDDSKSDDTEQMDTSSETLTDNDQSPLKSLSSLVSGPMDASTSRQSAVNAVRERVRSSLMSMLSNDLTQKIDEAVALIENNGRESPTQSSFLTESTIDEYPMENLFNSAANRENTMMDKEISKIATTSNNANKPKSTIPKKGSDKNKRLQLTKTNKLKLVPPNEKHKEFMHSLLNKHQKRVADGEEEATDRKLLLQPTAKTSDLLMMAQEAQPSTSKAKEKPEDTALVIPDTKALIEASKNLTQTLRKLSKQVLINKTDPRNPQIVVPSKIGPGAVIESMKHHGRGVYSGTFSGTLNPALQDSSGRPKRDISTIIHILNDLLCATPSIKMKDPKTSGSVDDIATCRICKNYSCHCQRLLRACDHPKDPEDEICKTCEAAKKLALENSKTKCKLEQLRLVMQQKKQRREARKQKPYTTGSPPQQRTPVEQSNAMQEEVETRA